MTDLSPSPTQNPTTSKMETETRSLLSKNRANPSYTIQEVLELRSFYLCLNWVCLNQTSRWKIGLSWSIFFLFAIGVPIISHYVLLCSNCDEKHQRPYDSVVQLSLSTFATISFVCLSYWVRKYGVRKFLFLDRLCDVSDKVRHGYSQELQKSMKLLCTFVLPSIAAESAYRIWWYATGGDEIPYLGNIYVSHIIVCTLQLCSWLYRTSLFILACIFYQLTCHLQILRLEDFAQVFQKETEVGSILVEHLSIRRNLRIISHRFRLFILLSLILVTASQFISLLKTTSMNRRVNFYEAGELGLCSISLVTGLFICLRSATKITHRAQAITSLAAKWHAYATINSFEDVEGNIPTTQIVSSADWESDEEDVDDDLENTKLVPIFTHTISFNKRQGLVTYLEHNRAGITVFGFMLDRTGIHAIFGIELALLLWVLNKTLVNLA